MLVSKSNGDTLTTRGIPLQWSTVFHAGRIYNLEHHPGTIRAESQTIRSTITCPASNQARVSLRGATDDKAGEQDELWNG